MTEPLATRLHRIGRQINAFAKLHGDELQMILDELRDLAADLEEHAAHQAETAEPDVGSPELAQPEPATGDPAAASPKRAKWLAEQERRSHPTRRELLRGRDDPAT